MVDERVFHHLMKEGRRLHAAGQLGPALVAFEQARTLKPQDANTASACATLLAATGQPQAAYQALVQVRAALWTHADGAANLAIAAEACGRLEEARAAYLRALELDPRNLRALRNTALLAAQAGAWDGAITTLRRCTELAPGDLQNWTTLADTLSRARRFAEAATVLERALQHFPGHAALRLRQPIVWAWDGQLEQAQQAFDAMDDTSRRHVRALLPPRAEGAAFAGAEDAQAAAPDAHSMYARHLFYQQALDAMQHCVWSSRPRLASLVREHLQRAVPLPAGSLGQELVWHAPWLPLQEEELLLLRRLQAQTLVAPAPTPAMPAFVATRLAPRDGRVRVGLALPSLHDPRTAHALERQLRLHDAERFALYLYTPTPQPELARSEYLAGLCSGFAEIAHMRPAEALARVRLDELDIFMDMAVDTRWWRPELIERRVAPVQLRPWTPVRQHLPGLYDYSLSDTFAHPQSSQGQDPGAVVRLPTTCWLDTCNDAPDTRSSSRAELGLPEHALVLCSLLPPAALGPQIFQTWMDMLHALPQVVWWLPATYSALAQHRLAQVAQAAGIAPQRLVFMSPCTRAQWLGRLPLADLLVVDGLPYSALPGLVDALRMGLPAVAWAGEGMDSRIGASIVRAAGLGGCVVNAPQALQRLVCELGKDRARLLALRSQAQALRASAALYDPEMRVRELEAAWSTMAQRQLAGATPAGFDVPACRGAARLYAE